MSVEDAWARLREAEIASWRSDRRVYLADVEMSAAKHERKIVSEDLHKAKVALREALNSELEAL